MRQQTTLNLTIMLLKSENDPAITSLSYQATIYQQRKLYFYFNVGKMQSLNHVAINYDNMLMSNSMAM